MNTFDGEYEFISHAMSSPLFPILIVWSLFWKGLSLWHAAKRGQAWWFMALLLISTAGILEIIYIFLIAKIKKEDLFK